ncbi:MAG: type VII secretion protein EssC [Bacilli bacterium]|nr:type VII secretion protein EssC [Bacilli bacterium]
MKLYLVDTEKLYTFDLPNKVNGSFLFSFRGINNIENTINIDAVDEKWVIKSNGNVDVIANSTKIESATLRDYIEYKLQVGGRKNIDYLYAMPSYDENVYKYEVKNSITTITIGKVNCNISYNNEQLLPAQLNISRSGNDWYVVPAQSDTASSFLNNKKIKIATKIYTGDVIFINGLKIIWMNKFLVVNNPQNLVKVEGLDQYFEKEKIDNTKYDPVPEEEAIVPLYTNNDYFSHTPRIRTVIEHKDVQIDSPPGNQEKTNDLPILLAIATSITMVASSIFMLYYSFYSLYRGGDKMRIIPRIILSFIMLFGALVVPRLMRRWQKKQRHKREMLRQQKYGMYLAQKEQEIQYILNSQIQVLNENNISLPEVAAIIKNKSRTIWSRETKENDFLRVRLGLGDCPADLTISAPEKHFSLDEDDLINKVIDVPGKYSTLKNIPITFSLIENNISSFIFDCDFKDTYIDGLLLQLFAFHSPLDLKIVLFTDSENEERWHYLKKLPHFWSADHSIRFFATDSEETKTVLAFLDKEFTRREENNKGDTEEKIQENRNEKRDAPYTKYNEYYLIITDDYNNIKNSTFLSKFLKENVNLGFSLVFFGDDIKNLPQECNTFVQIYEKESGIFNKELNTDTLVKFKADYDPTINMEELASTISNIPVKSKDLASSLPTSVSFLEMYKIGKIEQFNVLNRWSVNDPTNSLSAPIGVHINGDLFKLDLHEKYDGPHGLIAGSTGSGKSEFIITYILSMAINYHPYEVQFVLIDYKGGGLSGAFQNKETGIKLPHVVGTITNLDVAEMNRSLVSIESELKRRQAKFNEVRDLTGESTMDIYKYQRLYREGVIKEPMSHLFIISDEFAELKKQQPDFMTQLISTSRIGRSLGVHLILATQKPSGVVNDQIWSNSKFRVCLKVQTRGDSNEMLKRPDAASLKEAGRFYLQVGYDEYFDIGQSGWTGAKYIPSERIIKKYDETINFINNNGGIIKTIGEVIQKTDEEDNGDQLTNIVKYLCDIAEKENLNPRKMWLDILPEFTTVEGLEKKYNYVEKPYIIRSIIGEYDNPKNQEQGLYTINFSETGNLYIRGINGSGKENLLASIVYSICTNHTPEEINIYIGDFGAETLTMYNKMPHVGDVFTVNDQEKILNLEKQLDLELETRKKEFIDYGGSYLEYNKQNEKKKPLILVILNGFETFVENYPRKTEMFDILFRDGAKYGIVFIVSSTVNNILRLKVNQNFPNKISMKQSDNSLYRDLIGSPRSLIPADKFGRGIGLVEKTPLEFQATSVAKSENLTKTIKEKITELTSKYTYKVPPIKTLPAVCTLENVKEDINNPKGIPIGIELNSLDTLLYQFEIDRINIIYASAINNHINFFYGIANELLMNKNDVIVVDALNAFEKQYDGLKIINDKFDEAIRDIATTLNQDASNKKHTYYIFIGPAELKEKLSDQNKVIFSEIFKRSSLFKNSTFIFAENYGVANNIRNEDWYRANVDNSCGIWLGENVGNQIAITISNMSLDDKRITFPYIGYAVYKGNYAIIKYLVDGLEDDSDGE